MSHQNYSDRDRDHGNYSPFDPSELSYHSGYDQGIPARVPVPSHTPAITSAAATPAPPSSFSSAPGQFSTDKSGVYHVIGDAAPGPHDAERPNTLRRRFPVPAWLLEIGSILLSIGALLAAIVVMAVQNGKPVADWTFPASINTVVSTLGVISKVSLAFTISACLGQQKWNWFRQHQGNVSLFEVFDSASRGPWGSLGLLVFTRSM